MKNKSKKMFVSLFGAAFICLMLASPLSTTVSLNSETPKNAPMSLQIDLPFSAKKRTVSADWRSEYLSVVAGKETSALIYPSVGGFPVTTSWFDPLTAPDHLVDVFMVAAAQSGWSSNWNRPLWETPDGMYMYLYFYGSSTELTIANALSEAETLVNAANAEYGINMKLYWGDSDVYSGYRWIYLYYYDGAANLGTFTNNWTTYFPNEGIGALIQADKTDILNSPRVLYLDFWNSEPYYGVGTDWSAWLGGAYLDNDFIQVDGSTYNLSLSHGFSYDGTIQAASASIWSDIWITFPYSINCLSYTTPTTNLYPEVTGYFEYLLKANLPDQDPWGSDYYTWFEENIYEDIAITYDFSLEYPSIPVIKGEVTVSNTAINGGDLSATLTFENVGGATAYDIEARWPWLKEIEPVRLPVVKSGIYFDELLEQDFTLINPFGPDYTLTCHGWFRNEADDSVYLPDPATWSYDTFFVTEEFLIFDPGDFTETSVGVDGYSLGANAASLAPGATADFTMYLRKIPDFDNKTQSVPWLRAGGGSELGNYMPLDFDAPMSIFTWVFQLVQSGETDITLDFNTYGEWLKLFAEDQVNDVLPGIDLPLPEWVDDLHIPPSTMESFIGTSPGIGFRYFDADGTRWQVGEKQEYFGLTNGLIAQVYDDEASLKITFTPDKDVYLIGEQPEYTVTVENIGNITAHDIKLTGHYLYLDSDWKLTGIHDFTWTYDSTSNEYVNYLELGDLAAGATKTETVTGWGYYYLGMQGVMFSAEYTSDYGQGMFPSENFWGERDHRVGSNALAVLIHPSLEKQGEAEPSFPEPKLAITSTNSTETAVDWNSGLTYTARTITTTVTNEGDGPAIIDHIMQFINHHDFDFQFNDTHADMIFSTSSGDDLSENWFAITNDVMGISVAGLECEKEWNGKEWVQPYWSNRPLIELEPGESLTLTLRLRIQENGVDFPPVLIQASSKYPLYGGETGPIEDDNDAGTRMRSALTRFKRMPSPGTSRSNIRATRQGAEEAGTDPGYGAFGAGTGVTADSASPTLGTPVVSPETPTTGMIFNLQVSITDLDSGVSSVQIEIDTVRSDMLQLVTDLEFWKYTFLPFSEPTTVTYKIIASDVVGNEIESVSRDIVVIQGEPTSISDTSEKPSEDGGFIAGFELGVVILMTSTGALIRRRYHKHK